ncbi:hypothetical protein HZC30_06220 [Candidatus Woesearchaeota archaeon]|nr:hypothetical protein [Candidatus Woesearchaeota archaeon]
MSSDYHELLARAVQQHHVAVHLLTVTFPLAKEPKLLLGITFNLTSAMEYAIEALLAYERKLGLISAYAEELDFKGKLRLFKERCMVRNKIPVKYLHLLSQMHHLQQLHKTCPTEFQRGNKLVMCTSRYEMHTVSINDIKNYVSETREFVEMIGRIMNKG